MFDRLRRLMDSAFGAVLGGALYGSWAAFANWTAGAPAALRIGATHFAMSTGLTLAGVAIILPFVVGDRDAVPVVLYLGGIGLAVGLLLEWLIGRMTPARIA